MVEIYYKNLINQLENANKLLLIENKSNNEEIVNLKNVINLNKIAIEHIEKNKKDIENNDNFKKNYIVNDNNKYNNNIDSIFEELKLSKISVTNLQNEILYLKNNNKILNDELLSIKKLKENIDKDYSFSVNKLNELEIKNRNLSSSVELLNKENTALNINNNYINYSLIAKDNLTNNAYEYIKKTINFFLDFKDSLNKLKLCLEEKDLSCNLRLKLNDIDKNNNILLVTDQLNDFKNTLESKDKYILYLQSFNDELKQNIEASDKKYHEFNVKLEVYNREISHKNLIIHNLKEEITKNKEFYENSLKRFCNKLPFLLNKKDEIFLTSNNNANEESSIYEYLNLKENYNNLEIKYSTLSQNVEDLKTTNAKLEKDQANSKLEIEKQNKLIEKYKCKLNKEIQCYKQIINSYNLHLKENNKENYLESLIKENNEIKNNNSLLIKNNKDLENLNKTLKNNIDDLNDKIENLQDIKNLNINYPYMNVFNNINNANRSNNTNTIALEKKDSELIEKKLLEKENVIKILESRLFDLRDKFEKMCNESLSTTKKLINNEKDIVILNEKLFCLNKDLDVKNNLISSLQNDKFKKENEIFTLFENNNFDNIIIKLETLAKHVEDNLDFNKNFKLDTQKNNINIIDELNDISISLKDSLESFLKFNNKIPDNNDSDKQQNFNCLCFNENIKLNIKLENTIIENNQLKKQTEKLKTLNSKFKDDIKQLNNFNSLKEQESINSNKNLNLKEEIGDKSNKYDAKYELSLNNKLEIIDNLKKENILLTKIILKSPNVSKETVNHFISSKDILENKIIELKEVKDYNLKLVDLLSKSEAFNKILVDNKQEYESIIFKLECKIENLNNIIVTNKNKEYIKVDALNKEIINIKYKSKQENELIPKLNKQVDELTKSFEEKSLELKSKDDIIEEKSNIIDNLNEKICDLILSSKRFYNDKLKVDLSPTNKFSFSCKSLVNCNFIDNSLYRDMISQYNLIIKIFNELMLSINFKNNNENNKLMELNDENTETNSNVLENNTLIINNFTKDVENFSNINDNKLDESCNTIDKLICYLKESICIINHLLNVVNKE